MAHLPKLNIDDTLFDADSICGRIDRKYITIEAIEADYSFDALWDKAVPKCRLCAKGRLTALRSKSFEHYQVCITHLKCLDRRHMEHMSPVEDRTTDFSDQAIEASFIERDLYYNPLVAEHSWKTCKDSTHDECAEYRFLARNRRTQRRLAENRIRFPRQRRFVPAQVFKIQSEILKAIRSRLQR